MALDPDELTFLRKWHLAHVRRFDETATDAQRSWRSLRNEDSATVASVIETLRRTGDLDQFQAEMQKWAVASDTGFNSFSGQMVINQIAKLAPEPGQAASILARALETPVGIAEAQSKITELGSFVKTIQVGSNPSPKRVPFMLSYHWGLGEGSKWPVLWSKSANYLEYLTGLKLPPDPAERFARFVEMASALDGSPERFEYVAAWWSDGNEVVLDPVLCEWMDARVKAGASQTDDSNIPESFHTHAAMMVGLADHITRALAKPVGEALDQPVTPTKPSPLWVGKWPRADMWADWRIADASGLALRVWLVETGCAIGIRTAVRSERATPETQYNLIKRHAQKGYQIIGSGRSKYGEDFGIAGGQPGEFMFGKWFTPEALSQLDVAAEVVAISTALRPLIAEMKQLVVGVQPPVSNDPIARRVKEFIAARGYPTEADAENNAHRERFAELLRPQELPLVDPVDLRKIWTTGRYGGPGPQSVLNTSIGTADEVELERILNSISYLCWGDDPPEVRIDRLLTDETLKVRGLGESVIMKFLAISHPEQFLTVYPYGGTQGKLKMLRLLSIPEPQTSSRGSLHVMANDAIRKRLEPFFPNDPLGIGEFLYWLNERGDEEQIDEDVDVLDTLAEELLIDRAFIDDIVSLLEDKGQVIFYGPPGTGKTYFARKLAQALVPDATRRPIVQFHPSTSYEDFFEGYRPQTDGNGAMTYSMQPGPFADLARQATEAPGKRHLMIIDEINRANLPKVLGELLFLLEYRNVAVRTLYRPDDPFELPKDVWFIGTMNTADRSIALVDAALRRRFHFVPFFPSHGPMERMLDRWLAKNNEPLWVGELVALVNDELRIELSGPHLQIGPSYFMKRGLNKEALRRIWKYNIEPFIEDQFFGDPGRIDHFGFEKVLRRYEESVGAADGSLPDDADIDTV